jgi:hypothetical protein
VGIVSSLANPIRRHRAGQSGPSLRREGPRHRRNLTPQRLRPEARSRRATRDDDAIARAQRDFNAPSRAKSAIDFKKISAAITREGRHHIRRRARHITTYASVDDHEGFAHFQLEIESRFVFTTYFCVV